MEPKADNNLRDIIAGIANVVLGVQEKLFVPDLSAPVSALQANELIAELFHTLRYTGAADMIDDSDLNVRELIKITFAALGIEIEFSGRDKYEKAVVIDSDQDLATLLNLNSGALMPGQTVVRIASA
ncbi:hypothetical protein HQ865_00275 [Mucilaginibacter mali]|uniref:Uncharacterized protein n=1 Tax=Mucilaginibacter mali TaxID=2740462 RepID=A0A7D4U8J5_9SPHI|nr:hypothetical protein [Mucilaginibacter mali]QKJ28258.1 hypothetical protein HQ865_00275 [Mucilaginibacter mali]